MEGNEFSCVGTRKEDEATCKSIVGLHLCEERGTQERVVEPATEHVGRESIIVTKT